MPWPFNGERKNFPTSTDCFVLIILKEKSRISRVVKKNKKIKVLVVGSVLFNEDLTLF